MIEQGGSVASRRRLAAIVLAVSAAAAAAAVQVHRSEAGGGIGPDVTVYDLYGIGNNYAAVGDYRGYSVATRSCNQGNEPLNWCDEPGGCGGGTTSHDHPVIAQNLYRLKDGRFEQIGMSWLKHGFFALQQAQPECGNGTCQATSSNFLGVGCTDPYSASLNGTRPLGKKSEVNAATGEFPFPYTQVSAPDATSQRVRVLLTDLDPTLNAGARYWVEGHYVAPDDAEAENGLNNASYREVTVSAGTLDLNLFGSTVREMPAIAAWQAVDDEVELVAVDIPGSVPLERFHAGRRVTDLGGGMWHYEYAVHNLNSDRGAYGFAVDFPGATSFSNVGMHQIPHHSGEPYATGDWPSSTDPGAGTVGWATDDFATDANANALRWAATFSFWFDADAGPGGAVETLELFKPGSPPSVDFMFPGSSGAIFTDGFESGNTSAWTLTVP